MLPKLSTYRRRRVDDLVAEGGLRQVEAHERAGADRRAELADRDAVGEMRGGRREQIAAVEGARHRAERVRGVGELVRLGDPAARSAAGSSSPLSGPTKSRPSLVAQRKRAPMAADAGVDDCEMHPDRHVGQRVGEHERALQHRLRRDSVRDVDDLGLRGDSLDDAVAGSDEVVLQAEVGEKRDDDRV